MELLRILIVDDEVLVRIGIKSMTDWESHGFVIVGEADNGKRGYEMALTLMPDIVLTDIKMPQMDGLTLLKRLREEQLCSSVVMLSAYSDFDYVKQALIYGADDYILKVDLEEESLLNILTSLRERVEAVRLDRKRTSLANENIAYIQKRYMRELIAGDVNLSDVPEHLELIGVPLEAGYLRSVSVELSGGIFCSDYEAVSEQEEERIHKTFLNLLTEVTRNYSNLYAMDTDTFEYILVSGTDSPRENPRAYYTSLAAHIRDLALKYANTDVAVGISNMAPSFGDLHECARQSRAAVEYAVLGQKSPVVFYEDISFVDMEEPAALQEAVADLEAALAKLDISLVNDEICDVIDAAKSTLGLTGKRVLESWHVIAYMYRKFLTNLVKLGEINTEVQERLAVSLQESPANKNEFVALLDTLKNNSQALIKPSKSSVRLISEIKAHIDENSSQPLQLEDIAAKFSLSATHLSRLYKKMTGQSFVDYLTRVRIEKAKNLLLATDLRVSEISRMVGYDNIYYFSRVFKKITSTTPVLFRNQEQ
jgi:two-component system response regulator YesN